MAGYGYGYFKGGVPIGSNVNPFEPEYLAIYNTMITKPNRFDMIAQNAMIKDLKYLDLLSKAEFIDIFATHSEDSALINWANPSQFNPRKINSPLFEPYKGFTGAPATNGLIGLNFNPSVNSSKISNNNLTFIVGTYTDVDSDKRDAGGSDGITHILIRSKSSDQTLMYANDIIVKYIQNVNGRGHFVTGTPLSGKRDENINDYFFTRNISQQSTILNIEMCACGRFFGGVPEPSERQIAYVMLFTNLKIYEIHSIITSCEKYLRNYGKGLIDTPYSYMIPNTKVQLPLTTNQGDDKDAIHPSVINLGQKWNGYQFWMANTPMPQTVEYPHIYASNDGVNWEIPIGLINPIVPVYGGLTFAPDPELVFDAETLYCFYKYAPNGEGLYISYSKSTDGITWTPRVNTNIAATNSKSPAIVKVGNKYYMYCEDNIEQKIKRYSADYIEGNWTLEGFINITGRQLYIGHLGVLYSNGVYILCINATISTSSDGINFTDNHQILYNTESYEVNTQASASFIPVGVYRPSLCLIDNKLYCYYSYLSSSGIYRTARVEFSILMPKEV